MFDTIVIGKGLIGSAAIRYLSEHSANVAAIGPDEPVDWATHQGVFASHYDQGRITRILDVDPVWALLAKRSIEQYRTIEANSGIDLYTPSGGLQINYDPERVVQLERVGHQLGAEFKTFRDPAALKTGCPLFSFPEDMTGTFESGGAGYINPRALVAAQLTIAQQQGASVLRETVISVESHKDSVTVTTTEGHSYQAKKILLAAGAYTNMLLDAPLDLTLKPRTILLAELPDSEITRLANLPTLMVKLKDNPHLLSIYMVPGVQYSDGKTYIKIGGYMHNTPVARSFEELRTWFNTGGSRAEAEALKAVLLDCIPDLNATAFRQKPCVITYTAHERPYIDTLEEGRIFVAAGGCGTSAKSSNEIGRLAASLTVHNAWLDQELHAKDFQAIRQP
ncbi:MAG: FAD-dependent oxidoreductase [Anaerolineae bacterium]|nr:FAD-dependent oxidoreductase [Anaerolineae bacterium]